VRALIVVFTIFAAVAIGVGPSYADSLTVTLVSIVSPIASGGSQQLVVQTQTGTACSGDIQGAQSGGSAKGGAPSEYHLPNVQADDQGKVTWAWKLGMNFPKGHRTIRVFCKNGSSTGGLEVGYDVQ
jgi:hypothetical protein